MAGDPVVAETTSCTRCGTKFAVSRDRCPKCRTLVPQVDPAADAARSRRLQQICAAIIAIFLLIVGGLWLMRAPEPDESAMARGAWFTAVTLSATVAVAELRPPPRSL